MPKIHYACALLLFIATPFFNIVVYIAVLISGAESGALFGYMTFCTILSVLVLIWFFANLVDDFHKLKSGYLKAK